MGYSNYKNFKYTLKTLKLEEFELPLFDSITPIEPSEWLKQSLAVAEELPLTNEKSKSERIISPILSEIALHYKKKITFYSGEDLTVDSSKDLSGECDFFFSKHPRKSVMQAPIITLVEAKDEDFEYGKAQCTAQMYGSSLFNEQEGHPMPFIYGCVATADAWKFLKLEKHQIYVDAKTYYLSDLPKIVGIFHQIIEKFLAL
jgi:hypothetical protein